MLDRSKVIALVKARGPLLPSHLTKDLNTSVMFVSAILSELVDKKELRLSNGKVGGSPLYYYPGQETRLPELLYGHLHEKEKKAFDLLKREGIVRDRALEPVIRVALRAIKDFAIPFEVRRGEDVEIFWKYFTIPDPEAEKKIREMLSQSIPARQEEKKTSSKKKKSKNLPRKKNQSRKNRKELSRRPSRASSTRKTSDRTKKRIGKKSVPKSQKKLAKKSKSKTASQRKKGQKPKKMMRPRK